LANGSNALFFDRLTEVDQIGYNAMDVGNKSSQ